MVRDLASTVDRDKLDAALKGELTLPTNPSMDGWSPDTSAPIPPPWGQREPTDAEVESLRETWGADAASRASEQRLESFLGSLPPKPASARSQLPRIGKGAPPRPVDKR